ncbi:MAG: nucleotidyltransferase family protein [Aquaticitalea sp.]
MSKNKQTLKQTIQLIVDILSFDSDDATLKDRLSTIDWDPVVKVSSEHLVLPAIYCRLQQKHLLQYLPEDLVLYLNELTELNRQRNRSLLTEVEQISTLFKSYNINHVFIKGTALLAGTYFEDLGERMIGDIDILVASDDINQAFELLVRDGYSDLLPFNYEVKNYRHRPRQISETRIGAIELHDQLLKHKYNHLLDKETVLKQKETVHGIPIPSAEHLIWNTILGQQVNDRSYYYNILNLKGLFDVMVVGLPKRMDIISSLSIQTYGLAFLNLVGVFIPTLAPSTQTLFNRFNRRSYLLTLKFPLYKTFLMKCKSTYLFIQERVKLLIYNKSYRRHLFKNK